MAATQPKWGGVGYLNPALNILARLYGGVAILGLIAPQGITFNGVKNISKEDLKNIDYDLILVFGTNPSLVPILKEAETLGIDENKVVLDRTVCIPLFTLEKYNKLRRSKLSILSMNCWGGLIYNKMGLEFLSPTINMRTGNEEQFMNFLENPFENMNKELQYLRFYHDKKNNIDRPIFNLGKTEWWMVHNDNQQLDSIIIKWYKRRYKINWYNLLFVMHTKKIELLKTFDRLPYAKKVCFVPFETDIDSAFYMNPENYGTDNFEISVAPIARDTVFYYDIWDMLLYGKKTPLIIK